MMEMMWALLSSALAGTLAGLVAVGGLLATNCGQLLTLLRHDPQGWGAGLLLVACFCSLFGLAAATVTALSAGAADH